MNFNNTSDFVSDFWTYYISIISIVGIVGCAVLLWMQSSAKHVPGQTTNHVWDEDLQEYSNPLPNWWRWLFYLTVIFSLVYLALYPGLGSYAGVFHWTMRGQYDKEKAVVDAQFNQAYGQLLDKDLVTVAADPKAREAGQRLFLNYCAQCHASDGKGAKGFPNLTDNDWLWGGTPDQIEESISQGRMGVMPAKGLKPDLTGDQIKDLANYVRSLSGLAADSIRVQRGKELFAQACAACHGADGKGNVGVAPNLTDKIWLYGSSEDAIIETITKGRQNRMPAWGEFLGPGKVHLLAAYVYSLGGGVKPTTPEPAVPGSTPEQK
ncbi:MAG: cytochrome-c oxidase, cbb3-type subunit III [Proteobacteria bacterium]|nr:cytochrome-c oxidase, cbb3-type subunit III [Pseudomonadota bacterium]HQR03458.1 cytochrome-c oxidase, cbb3-type subunit III [Rhodocyclaceae bacterium]